MSSAFLPAKGAELTALSWAPEQGTPAAGAAYTPDANVVDAFWERTEGLLLRGAPDEDAVDADVLDDAEQGTGSAAAELAAAKVRAVAAAGRLVVFQVRAGLAAPCPAVLRTLAVLLCLSGLQRQAA